MSNIPPRVWWNNLERILLAVDDLVGRVVSALAASGRLSNTLIMFASDNGVVWGEHSLAARAGYILKKSAALNNAGDVYDVVGAVGTEQRRFPFELPTFQ